LAADDDDDDDTDGDDDDDNEDVEGAQSVRFLVLF
jgi:hypothetical protein